MTSWRSLVQEIRRDPIADAPRLVAADFLTQNGDERGDYIARACGGHPIDDYVAREATWCEALVALGANNHPVLRRGFIDEVHLDGEACKNLVACCALEPIVHVVLRDTPPKILRDLARADELVDLLSLALVNTAAGTAELLRAPLGKVEDLYIDDYKPAVVRALATGAIRPTTFELNLDSPSADLDVVTELVDGGFFTRIAKLTLVAVSDDVVDQLARAPLAHLTHLEVVSSRITAGAVEALGARLDRLTSLSIERLDRATADALISQMPSANLRRLTYAGPPGPLDGLATFVKSRAFRGVEDLDLGFAQVDAAVLEGTNLRRISCYRKPAGLALDGVEIREQAD